MNRNFLGYAGALLCTIIIPSMAADSPVPEEVFVGTDSALRADFKKAAVSSPRALQGRYRAESGDGVTTVHISITAPAAPADPWTVTGKIEEHVAGEKGLHRSIKAVPLRNLKGFWTFDSNGMRGVFASFQDKSVKQKKAEPGLILSGAFLFKTN